MAKVGKYLPGIACFFILGSKAQTSYTFTNAGSTGSLGPTQAMVNSAYASTSLSTAVTVSAGIQSWTVPTTGLYEIEAAGGSGGDYFSFKFGGLGAIMKGQFLLNSGDLLQILVGQRGTNSCTGSGGGGSYVLKNGSLILAAGGGGGCSTQQNGVSGTVSINGTMCSLNAVLGGSMGLGGQTCPVPGSGGAGGGFLAGSSGNGQGLFMTGGTSFLNGGIGGAAGPTSTMYIVAPGGFGGGGGAQQCAEGGGGGGGYSGGAGGQEANTCVNGVKAGGGGGGSFNTGLNQVNTSGVNSGHGRVTLTYLCNAISLVSSSNPICFGNTATLSTNAISSYTWSNNSNSAFIIVSPSVTTNYTVQGLSSSNCMSYSVITLSVTSQPSVTVSPFNPSVCANSTLVLNANTNGGTAPYTYSWTGGPQNPAYSVSYTTGIANETIVVTDANNCVSSGTVSITVAANPTLNAPNNSICPGSSASLSVSGANSYTWLPSAVTGNSLVVSPTASVVYTVLGVAINGCTSSINSTLSVLQVPLLNLISQSITCASLGSASVVTSGGIGPFTYTWLPGLQTSSVVNGLNPNTYSIIVHDLGTGCSTSTVQVFNSLIPLSGILANSQSITCPGASSGTAAVLNISGGSASQNYLWTNGTMSTSVSSPTNLSAGQWTVTVTDALTACQINSVFTILQPPANTLVISASSASICAGGVASFTATNNGGTPFTAGPAYTYSWSSGSTGSVYSSTPSIAGSLIHTVWSIDANSCAATQSILLTVVPLPTLSLNSVSICPLQVATLTATGASSYTWYPGLITGNSFTQSPASTQQFTVVGSAFSCNASATASIVLKTSPSPSITTNAPLCNGQTLSLTASGGSVYQWSGVLGFVSGSSAVLIPSVNPIQSGVYTVTVTGVNSCTASASINVTVHPNPTLTAIGSTVCSTQSMSLMAFSVPGATYLWNGPNGYSSAFQGTVVASPAASLSGVYQVTANSLQNCSSTATALVNITAAPAISITASNPKCLGGTLHLSGFGGTNYIWQGPNGFYSTLQNPSLSALSFSNTGTWSLTAITGPCTLTTALNIQVNPLPQPYASYNTPLCELNNLMLSVSPAQSYTWSGPQGFSSNSQNPTLSSVSFSNAGQYSVNVTDVNGCTGDTLVNVNVLSNPIPIATGATVCLGGSVNLSASGGVSYLWNGPNSFLSSNQNIFLQGVTAGQTGNYTVLITASNSCSSYTTVNLLGFNYSLPNPVIVATTTVCVNAMINLQASGGASYAWSGPEGFVSTSNMISFLALNTGMSGTYTLTVINSSFCAGSNTVYIQVNPLPEASLQSTYNKLCVPFCTDFTLVQTNTSLGLQSVQYYIEGKVYSGPSAKACIKTPGNQAIYAIYTDLNGCSNNASLSITAFEKPKADFEYFPLKPVAGVDEVTFYNRSLGNNISNWSWYFISGDSLLGEKQVYRFEEAGSYPVALLISNSFNCYDTIVKVVQVEDDFALYVPNAFTPNADGLNDLFRPVGTGLKAYKIEIYNRWGKTIYVSEDFFEGWDGTFQGELCKEDVYSFKIECTKTGGKTYNTSGWLMLER